VRERDQIDVDEVLRENVDLREQQQAVSRVMRAVARPDGLQPVLDEMLAAAGQILIGQRVFAAVEENIDAASVGELELKGFVRPIAAYEVRRLRSIS
jgi:hypothetical protein